MGMFPYGSRHRLGAGTGLSQLCARIKRFALWTLRAMPPIRRPMFGPWIIQRISVPAL